MKKIFLLSLIAASVFQFSCKKNDEPTPFVQDTNTGLQTLGISASGTINTFTATGVVENFSFNFPYSAQVSNYTPSIAQSISIDVYKDFVSGATAEYNEMHGTFNFGAADSIHSKPTSYVYYLNATNANTNGTFLFSNGNPISEANSTITNYALNGNTISFTITTNAAYKGNNGQNATIVSNIVIPFTLQFYRLAN